MVKHMRILLLEKPDLFCYRSTGTQSLKKLCVPIAFTVHIHWQPGIGQGLKGY